MFQECVETLPLLSGAKPSSEKIQSEPGFPDKPRPLKEFSNWA